MLVAQCARYLFYNISEWWETFCGRWSRVQKDEPKFVLKPWKVRIKLHFVIKQPSHLKFNNKRATGPVTTQTCVAFTAPWMPRARTVKMRICYVSASTIQKSGSSKGNKFFLTFEPELWPLERVIATLRSPANSPCFPGVYLNTLQAVFGVIIKNKTSENESVQSSGAEVQSVLPSQPWAVSWFHPPVPQFLLHLCPLTFNH